MSRATVTITGGSGFVGQLVNALRREWLGANAQAGRIPHVRRLRALRTRAEDALLALRVLRPTGDDILDLQSKLVERFRGSRAVVHLAALPHPNVSGAEPDDYRRINYDGAVNVFAAAQEAGVPKLVFASSAQVYGINDPVRIDQFPILESNYLPTMEDGQTPYGALKAEFERHLAAAALRGDTQAIALRLECPGVRSDRPNNFFTSTSIENTTAGFACAIEAELEAPFEAFNLVDGQIDPGVVDVQAFLRERWPEVPNHTEGNESLLGIEKARRLLGYDPIEGGTYYPMSLIWG